MLKNTGRYSLESGLRELPGVGRIGNFRNQMLQVLLHVSISALPGSLLPNRGITRFQPEHEVTQHNNIPLYSSPTFDIQEITKIYSPHQKLIQSKPNISALKAPKRHMTSYTAPPDHGTRGVQTPRISCSYRLSASAQILNWLHAR
jgi:hypothetical protein